MSILRLTYNIFTTTNQFVGSTNTIWKEIEKLKTEFLFEYGITFGLKRIREGDDEFSPYGFNSYYRYKHGYRHIKTQPWSNTVYVSKHAYVIMDGFGRIVEPSVLFAEYEKEFGKIKYKFYHTFSNHYINGRSSNSDRGERNHAYGRTKVIANIGNVKREYASWNELQYYSKEYLCVNTATKPPIPNWGCEKNSYAQKNWKKYRKTQYKANNGKD